MRRFVLPIAAVLLTAACGSSAGHASSQPAAKSSEHTAPHAGSRTRAAEPKPSPTKACGPARDIDVWMKVPGLPDSAQVLGSHGPGDCESTFEMLRTTSPTQAGYCTKAAYASDNPGYDANAMPAARLKKVQVAIGPAC
ncbi:hypothetical protein ACIQCF_25795 [Streptomyces sp. NPDC088353]|uniref:hypothetical protein n=1 Tax=Streptomyces sp. NPDC088353 TaxID=3365855 RepID=UPI0038125426